MNTSWWIALGVLLACAAVICGLAALVFRPLPHTDGECDVCRAADEDHEPFSSPLISPVTSGIQSSWRPVDNPYDRPRYRAEAGPELIAPDGPGLTVPVDAPSWVTDEHTP